MTIKKHLLVRNVVALLAATPLLWIAPPAIAQSAPTQDSRPAQDSISTNTTGSVKTTPPDATKLPKQ